jgi:hypothetical protein
MHEMFNHHPEIVANSIIPYPHTQHTQDLSLNDVTLTLFLLFTIQICVCGFWTFDSPITLIAAQ